MQINLENFGGYDVKVPLSETEKKARVKEAARFLAENSGQFADELDSTRQIVQNNIAYFSSEEFCEGPMWDEMREAVIDMTCKLQAIWAEEVLLLED